MSLTLRASRLLCRSPSVAVKQFVANSHTLVLPPDHNYSPLTPFENGVPVKKVRELSDIEKKWDFWSSSDAFSGAAKPESGWSSVPVGQAWVIQRGSSYKVVKEGSALILPLVDKVKAVKNTQPIAIGVISPAVNIKDGSSVNAYAVVYFKVTDILKSTLYVDPETNKSDSERAAAKLIRKTLEFELANGVVEKAKFEEKIKATLASKADEYGLEVDSVEFRGLFPESENLSDKLRALEPPLRPENAPGHGLSADYWAEVLSPPYFQKKKFGTSKEPITPAAVTLEWVCPSPPDFHHFNEMPRMTAAPPAAKEVKKAH